MPDHDDRNGFARIQLRDPGGPSDPVGDFQDAIWILVYKDWWHSGLGRTEPTHLLMQLPRVSAATTTRWESQFAGIDLPAGLAHSDRITRSGANHKLQDRWQA
jgi:hypothetical protein